LSIDSAEAQGKPAVAYTNNVVQCFAKSQIFRCRPEPFLAMRRSGGNATGAAATRERRTALVLLFT